MGLFSKKSAPQPSARPEYIEVGQIVNTHGVRGEVKVQPWDVSPELLCGFKTFYMDGAPFRPTSKRVQGDMVLMTETNDNGNYALDVRDAEGEYQLIFVKEKYQSDTTAVTFDQQSLVREATLLRLNTLSGTIYAKRGEADPEPLMGATINVLGLAGATGNFLLESDADGHFSVDIPAGNGLYGIYVTMVGLNAANKTVTMSGDDLQAPDIILLDAAAAGVDGVEINDAARQGDVYTLNGELVGRNLDLNTLPKGLYIVNGRKVVVK